MKKIKYILNKFLEMLTALAFIAMVLLVFYQVLTRYLLHNPSYWSEEIVSFIFVWMSLLGASLVLSERNHMNIPVIIEKFSIKNQKYFKIFAEIIAIIFSAMVLIYGGIYLTKLSMAQSISSFKIPLGYFYLIIPICGILNILFSIINIEEIVEESRG